jgi:predicted TIM-barrel fold metal-dependent hydrolase
MFHCNDPEDFFYPINQFNFWLGANKGKEGTEQGYWGRLDKFVSREQLMHERENMFHKHPNTTFIMAHFGFLERQLPLCADIFDRYPNVYVEVSVALDNLARSPKEGAAFLTKYSTRIMFGIDEGTRPVLQGGWEGFYNRYFAIFELDQDDLPVLKQPRAWTTVHGLNLSKEVLERIYYKNAEELLARPVHLPPAR